MKFFCIFTALVLAGISTASPAAGKSEAANLRVVKKMVQSYQGGDVGSVMKLLADEVTIQLTVSEGTPLSGVFKGKDGVNQYFSRNADTVETQAMEVQNFLAGGNQVAVLGRETIKIKHSGELMQDADWVMLCTLKAGKIVAIEVIEDTAALSRAYR